MVSLGKERDKLSLKSQKPLLQDSVGRRHIPNPLYVSNTSFVVWSFKSRKDSKEPLRKFVCRTNERYSTFNPYRERPLSVRMRNFDRRQTIRNLPSWCFKYRLNFTDLAEVGIETFLCIGRGKLVHTKSTSGPSMKSCSKLSMCGWLYRSHHSINSLSHDYGTFFFNKSYFGCLGLRDRQNREDCSKVKCQIGAGHNQDHLDFPGPTSVDELLHDWLTDWLTSYLSR